MVAVSPPEFYAAKYLAAQVAKAKQLDATARPRVESLTCVHLTGETSACLAVWHGLVSGRKVAVVLKVSGSKVTNPSLVEP